MQVKVRHDALPDVGPSRLREIESKLLATPLKAAGMAASNLIDRVLYDRLTTFATHKARVCAIVGRVDGVAARRFYLQFLHDRRPIMLSLSFRETPRQTQAERMEELFANFLDRFALSPVKPLQPQDGRIGRTTTEAFTDPKGLFRVTAPAGWKIEEFPNDPRSKVRWHCPSSDAVFGVIVKVGEVQTRTIEDLIANLKRNYERLGIQAKFERISLPGGTAVRRTFDYMGMRCLMISFHVPGEMAHDIMYTASPEHFEAFKNLATKSIQSYEPLGRAISAGDRLGHLATSKIRQAEIFLQQGDRESALQMVNKGLDLIPGDSRLLALRKRIELRP